MALVSATALSFEREFPANEGIFNVLPIGIGIVDSGLAVLRMNAALRKIFSCPDSQDTPVALAALDGRLAELLDPVVHRVLESNDIAENVELVSAPPARQRVVLATVFPIDAAAGTVGMAIRDITEFHRIHEAERVARRVEVTQRLAGGIAHDFNNLLTAILGNASIILESGYDRDMIERAAREIIAAAERAAVLTHRMLAFAGKYLFIQSELVLSDLVRATEPQLRSILPKTATLYVRLEPDLPPVRGDATQLKDVIEILARNAVEAIAGSPAGRIEIETGTYGPGTPRFPRFGNSVYVVVRDNGSGIDSDVLPKIFEPFFTTKFPGRGLGLAAAQGIIHGCGGEIEVQSRPGSGSSFRVIFPVVKPSRI
jgi:two-component system cell cycle sensor histidine kinase/response regulator CckA